MIHQVKDDSFSLKTSDSDFVLQMHGGILRRSKIGL